MRPRLLLLSLLFGLTWLSACIRPAQLPGPERMQTLSDPLAGQALDRLGQGPSLVILLRSEGSLALLKELGSLSRIINPNSDWLFAAPDLGSALARSLTLLAKPQDLSLRGLDPKRPLALGLFEPFHNDVVRLATSGLPEIPPGGVPPILHRAWLPAVDVAILENDLVQALLAAGLKAHVWQGAQALPAGCKLMEMPEVDGFLVIQTKKDGLRLLLATEDWLQPETAAQGRQMLLALLARPVLPWSREADAANLHLLSDRAPFVAHFDTKRIVELTDQMATGQIGRALAHVPVDMRDTLTAAGLSILMRSHLMLTKPGAELGAWSLSLRPGVRGLDLRLAVEQTQRGRDLAQAALAGAGPTLRLKQPALAEFSLSLDLDSAMELASIGEEQDFLETLRECGFGCTLDLLLRRPLVFAKNLRGLAGKKLDFDLPRSIQIVFLKKPNDVHQDLPGTLALAAAFAPNADKAKLRKLITEAGGLAQKADLHFDDHKGQRWLRLGLGVDPREVFGLEQDKHHRGTMSLHMDLAGLEQGMDSWTKPLSALGTLRLELDEAEGAWLLRIELSTGPKAQDWDKEVYRNLGKSGAPENTKPSCLRQAQGALASGLQAVYRAPPESQDMMLVRTWTETLPQLDCAMREADTREHAKDLVSAWSLMLAKRRGRAFDQQTQLVILDSACKRAVEAACLQAKDVRAGPQIELPSTDLIVGFPLPRTEVIHLRAKDRTQAKPNNLGQTIARNRALSRSMSTYEQNRNSRAELLLAVEGQTSIKAFDELLRKLGAVGAERVAVLLRSPSGVRAVDIELSSVLHSDTPSPKAKQVEAGPRIRGMLGLAKQEATWPNIPDRFARLETPRKLDHKPIQHAAVLTVSSSEFLLRSLGRIHRLSRKDPQDATEFMRELRQAEPLYLKAIDGSHFSDLAFGLAMAVDARSKRTVLVGPPPPIVLEVVKQKQGLLAILGKQRIKSKVRIGKPTFAGSVDPGPIRRVIGSKLAVFRNCYERELAKNPTLKGKITATWVINTKGKVAKISKIESTMKNESVINCIKAKIKSLRFLPPKDGKDMVVRCPFIFKPGK